MRVLCMSVLMSCLCAPLLAQNFSVGVKPNALPMAGMSNRPVSAGINVNPTMQVGFLPTGQPRTPTSVEMKKGLYEAGLTTMLAYEHVESMKTIFGASDVVERAKIVKEVEEEFVHILPSLPPPAVTYNNLDYHPTRIYTDNRSDSRSWHIENNPRNTLNGGRGGNFSVSGGNVDYGNRSNNQSWDTSSQITDNRRRELNVHSVNNTWNQMNSWIRTQQEQSATVRYSPIRHQPVAPSTSSPTPDTSFVSGHSMATPDTSFITAP